MDLTTILYTLGSVIGVSLISFVGVFTLSLKKELLNKITFFLIAVAVGGLFGGAFIHLIPEAFEKIADPRHVSFAILAGILLFFVIEKSLHWHHCHKNDCAEPPQTVAQMNLIGDGIHNFLDGVIIAASFMISIPIGIATTVAVILHEIPQEISDFGVLIYGGYSRKKALIANFFVSATAVAGAIVALIVGPSIESVANYILPFAAGAFIYIAGSDLLPEIRKEQAISKVSIQFFGILLGLALMMLITLFE